MCVCVYVWSTALLKAKIYLQSIFQLIWGMGQILGKMWYFVQNYLCQFYFNYFAIVVIINKTFKLLQLVLVFY